MKIKKIITIGLIIMLFVLPMVNAFHHYNTFKYRHNFNKHFIIKEQYKSNLYNFRHRQLIPVGFNEEAPKLTTWSLIEENEEEISQENEEESPPSPPWG